MVIRRGKANRLSGRDAEPRLLGKIQAGDPRGKTFIRYSSFGRLGKRPVIALRTSHDTNTPDEILKISKRLSRAGILVPEIVGVSKSGVISFSRIGSRKKGVYENSLMGALRRLLSIQGKNPSANRQLRRLLSSAARTIGTMHSIGILHNHPHFLNLVASKSRIGVIDLKYASEVKIDWRNPKEAAKILSEDYRWIVTSFRELGIHGKSYDRAYIQRYAELSRNFILKIVSKYPMDERRKDVFILEIARMTQTGFE
ncbi:MAG: hypothetical protein AABW99_01850 [archaeon]